MLKRSLGAACAIALVATAHDARAQNDDEEIPSKPAAPAPSPKPTAAIAPAQPAASSPAPARAIVRSLLDDFVLTAYLQTQYESHQDSDDQLRQGGVPYNQDRFVVRRARIRLEGDWEYAAVRIETDGNTVHGPTFGLRNAWASLQYRPDRNDKLAPFVVATMGLFDTPFGYELHESPRTRPFMERSTASRSMFPGEPDVGLKIHGGLMFFRWTAAVLNGEPLDEKNGFAAQDPNQAKDVMIRVGVDTDPRPFLNVAGGVSALRGKGFHAGSDPTKAGLQWRDLNEDGVVQLNELTPIPATSGTPSQNFERWLVGADMQVNLQTRFGKTKVYGEVQVGNNMDRGLFPSDPVINGIDTRQFGWYVGVLQDVTKYGVVGVRYDYYDPNSDVFDKRGGKLLPFSQVVTTWSPLVGLVLPHARLYAQYDLIGNKLARDDLGVPSRLKMNALTLRLQVEL